MSIRLKVGFIIIALSIVYLVGVLSFSDTFLLKNIQYEEKRFIYEDVERTLQILNRDIHSLESTSLDWAGWDDTFYFLKGENPNYVENNLMDETFENLDINMFALVDLKGSLKYSKGFDCAIHKNVDISEDLIEMLRADQTGFISHKDLNSTKSGLAYFKGRPIMLSSAPVYRSNKNGSIEGTLILGRYICESRIHSLEAMTDSVISISGFHTNKIDDYTKFNYSEYPKADKDKNILVYTKMLNRDTAEGITVIKDVFGKESLVLSVRLPRFFYKGSINNLLWFVCSFIIAITMISTSTMIIIKRLFLSRIEALDSFVKRIKTTKNTSLRLDIKGQDELANLGLGFNLMLDTIELASQTLRDNEERLRLIMEGSNDGFWDIDLTTYDVYFSQRLLDMIEFDENKNLKPMDIFRRMLQQEGFETLKEAYQQMLRGEMDFYKGEHRLVTANSNIKWLFIRGKIVARDKNQNPIRLTGIVTDITETKQDQEVIEYLSFHDSLTGLFNRPYFLNELRRIDNSKALPVSLIMGDVNGLKLTNDAFGHYDGDRLLVEIGEILKKACRKSDIIARLGGDEFVVLLPYLDEKEAMEVCDRIKLLCDESAFKPIKPSIALGVVTKTSINENLDKLFETAEDRMYRNKLLESRSARHSMIALIERTLYEMDPAKEEHIIRLNEMAVKMGTALNLSSSELDDLTLLTKLHDIGKTALPIEIVTKPEALTVEEGRLLRQHPEIGYRIAMATPDLAQIADSILSQHEHWDGSGYPRGIPGAEIPLLARIIAIADFMDAKANPRHDNDKWSRGDAMEELQKHAGTYFDPSLVEVFIKLFGSENKA